MKPSKHSDAISGASQMGVDIDSWQRKPAESPQWFARFDIFRLLGSDRSIDGAWRQEPRTKTNKNGRAPDSWHKAARRFDWRERALSWDLAVAARIGQQVINERIRRLKRALHHRQRRESYLDGLERTLRIYKEKVLNKVDPVADARSIEFQEARIRAHFGFMERMMRLGQAEYAAEEQLLADVAIRQQRAAANESALEDESICALENTKCVPSDRSVLAADDSMISDGTKHLLHPVFATRRSK